MNKKFLLLILLLTNISIASENNEKQPQEIYSRYNVINHPKNTRNITNITLYYDQKYDFLTKDFFYVLQPVEFKVINDFQGKDACYISCLSENNKASFKSKKYGNIVGFIRVKGESDKEFCNPYDIKHDNHNLTQDMIQICNEYISLCDGNICSVNTKTTKIFQGSNNDNNN